MNLDFNFIAITNSVNKALVLDKVGINQIMIDCEYINKNERQIGKNAVINSHKFSDIKKIKDLNLNAEIICRINPFYNKTEIEIEDALDYGADIIMIPMINNIKSYSTIIKIINKRCNVLPLIETPYSVFKLDEILSISNTDQVHFGLNDLSISLKTNNIFEILLSPIFIYSIKYSIQRTKITGFGGIGNPFVNQSINPMFLLNEHLRIGSKSVILSRSFFQNGYEFNEIKKSLDVFKKFIQKGKVHSFNNLKLEIEKL
tara:strand:+ start:663 stop:1439 length:777 start_codon:yes stop_codon:yes gene_type:complete